MRLLAHPLPLMPFVLKAPRIVYGYRKVIAQPLQQAQLLAREGIQLMVRSGEDSHQPPIHEQGNRHLGQCGLLAGDIIRILAYVRRVAHFSGGGHVAHQTVLSYF